MVTGQMMYQFHTLPNGLRILMVPVPAFKSVSTGIFVGVGSRYENEAQAGAAHFIEHMLFKGTHRRPSARLIAEAIEGIGGVSNAYTDQETTVYYAKVAASQAAVAIDVLTDLVRRPLFEPVEFDKEKYVIGEELDMVYDSPDEWVHVLIDQLIWPDHPLGHNVAGTHQSLAGLSREALVSFYQASYHPQNMLIALGGAFAPEQVVAQLDSLLGDWQPAAIPAYQPAGGPQTEARWYIEDRATEQGHLNLAVPTLPRNHPDRYVLSVLNAVLGDGMSSRLFLTIREEKGLAYAVDSGLNLLRDTGSLVVYAGVDPERGVEALQAILAELARLCDEPVPEQELRKTKEYLKGRLLLGLEDSFSQAAWVAYQAMFLDSIKTPEAVVQAYEAVTATEVQALARQLFRPTAYNLAAVGPFGDGESLVRSLIG
jgi:predicted Zn-dependent peptidase